MTPTNNPLRRLNTLNTGAIPRQQKRNYTPNREILWDLVDIKLKTDPADKDKWNEIRKEISYSTDFSDERITEIYEQLQPDFQKSHKHISKGYVKEFNDLTTQYQENLTSRKEYINSESTARLAEIDVARGKILDNMVNNLEKQKSFYSLAIEVEYSQKGMVNLKKINELKENLTGIDNKLFSLHTKQSQYANRKDFTSSNEAIKNFDRQNKEVISLIQTLIPTEIQVGFGIDANFASHISDLNKTSTASNPSQSQKNLADASKEILKFLDNTRVEKDLHKELDKLEGMLGSKTPSANIKIANNIDKIKIRLGILDSLRDLREILQSGKLDADGARILGYMLVATTNYKIHDSAMITRTLAVFTEYMKSNPVKTVSGSIALYLFAIFLAQLYVLNSLEEIKETKDNVLINDLNMDVCKVWLEAAKEMGIDLSTTNYEEELQEIANSATKITNALSELKKIEDAGNMKEQKKISEKQFNKLTPEEKELLYKQDSALNKLDSGYLERKTLENVPVNDSMINQAIYKTLRDGLAPVIGDKMPEFINGVKEAAIICNTIRHHVTVANAEIEKNRIRLDAIRDELIQKVDQHIKNKVKETNEQGYFAYITGSKIDITELRKVQVTAINEVKDLTSVCEAKLHAGQKLEVIQQDIRFKPKKPEDFKETSTINIDSMEMEKIAEQQRKDMGEQISGSNPNYE